MSLERVYLDYNASAPLIDAARTAVVEALSVPGNPSSVHAEGRAARRLVEAARVSVAALLGVSPRSLAFASGGTEAANLVLTPKLTDGDAPIERLLVFAGEHACVLQGHRFDPARVDVVPMTAGGVIDLAALADLLSQGKGRPMLTLQAANNETGVIQPVAEAAALVHAAGGLLVCDAVQAAGRVDLAAVCAGADAIFVSGHKIGGPKGSAALAFTHPRLHITEALVRGGGQERGLRGGTENVPAIAGFGAAASVVVEDLASEASRLRGLRDRLEGDLAARFADLVVFGGGAERLPQTSLIGVPGALAETLLIGLDLAGVAVSSGAACSSGKVQPSHVLGAMGVDQDMARVAIRVSLGRGSSEKDVRAFCEAFEKSVMNIRSRRIKSAA